MGNTPELYLLKKEEKRPDTCAARSAVRFEWLNQFFEETFGTACSYPQNIEDTLNSFLNGIFIPLGL